MLIKIGMLLQIFGFVFMAWLGPIPFVVGWGGDPGLDADPNDSSKILLWRDRNKRPYFKQRNRMRKDLESGCFVLGLILQLVGAFVS